MKIQTYRDLRVWQAAMSAAAEIYNLVKKLPKEETYALSDQMRRAAVSIPSNIAEGQGRSSTREFLQFLNIARGSIYELETQLLLSEKIQLLTQTDILPAMEKLSFTGKLLNALIKKLRSSRLKP